MKKLFFVGYLDFPKQLRTFFSVITPLLILAAMAATYFFTEQAPSVGMGKWLLDNEVKLTGTVKMLPYPAIITEDKLNHPILIVGFGKLAMQEELADYDNKQVEINGFMIERGRWQMLEVESLDSVSVVGDEKPVSLPKTASRSVTLRGEIVDSKCMLGVMTPGAGKVHRACAALCMAGGLPPMLLVTDAEGNKAAYLLVDEKGEPVGQSLIPYVATPVEISGEAFRLGDMPVIKVKTNAVIELEGAAKLAFGDSIGVADGPAFCRTVT